MNKKNRYYSTLKVLVLEEGLMIVRPKNEEKHLAYISNDRKVHFKDSSNLSEYEIKYIEDYARGTNKEIKSSD